MPRSRAACGVPDSGVVIHRSPRHRNPDGSVTGASQGAGIGLLSRGLSTGVPSALLGLTTVFGMGTGVAQAL